jgi:hypothetical protein
METKKAVLLANNLIDSEFENFNHNPKGYIESMGWDSKKKFASIDKLKGQLCPSAEDIINLRKIIESDCFMLLAIWNTKLSIKKKVNYENENFN